MADVYARVFVPTYFASKYLLDAIAARSRDSEKQERKKWDISTCAPMKNDRYVQCYMADLSSSSESPTPPKYILAELGVKSIDEIVIFKDSETLQVLAAFPRDESPSLDKISQRLGKEWHGQIFSARHPIAEGIENRSDAYTARFLINDAEQNTIADILRDSCCNKFSIIYESPLVMQVV